MNQFNLQTKFKPSGDQPRAIDVLTNGVLAGLKHQTLVGATGTGKTFTMANIIQNLQRPALILAHNKTLAAQLFSEFREFFPESSVQYFVSYYDYYQPEAYVPQRDLYIEKDSDINETIERYRSSATQSLLTQRNTIIVATVSCIYGLGNPDDYNSLSLELKIGENYKRSNVQIRLRDMQYERTDVDFAPGTYRIRGEFIDIYLTTSDDKGIRLEFFGDDLESIKIINPISGEFVEKVESIKIFPAKHYVSAQENLIGITGQVRDDLEKEVEYFKSMGKDIEAMRLKQRVEYDLEMIQETGYCKGIENYSRYIDRRNPGTAPSCLLDYFPSDYIMFVDESHITIPQIRGMYNGDKARKQNLVDFGFRLRAALDNRPLQFDEFDARSNQIIYTTATPSEYELNRSLVEVERLKKSSPELFNSQELEY